MAPIFPEHVLFSEILPKLPVKSLMRFKCVSRNWNARISRDRHFIDAHSRLQQHSAIILYDAFVDYDDSVIEEIELNCLDEDPRDFEPAPPTQIAKVFSEHFSEVKEVDLSYLIAEYGSINFTSSCSGLLCLTFDEFPNRVVLWNPATRQRRLLPSLADCNRLVSVGIGLDEASGDWKVVRLCMESDDPSSEAVVESLVRAHVLSKGDAVWRDSGVSGIKGQFQYRGMVPVAAAGALHWNFCPGRFINAPYNVEGVLSFDLTDEVFRFANPPPGPDGFALCNWRSLLAAVTHNATSTTLNVASPSCDGLTWSKLINLKLGVEHVWREHYLLRMWGRYHTLSLVDPKGPEGVRNLKQHICADSCTRFQIYDYVTSILSVF